jgi:hypothetical protein
MFTGENVQRNRGSAKLADVGRKRQRPAGEDIILGFKAPDALVKALDAEAEHMTSERQMGSSPVSRTEAIKVLLAEALAARAKARGERKQ